VRKQWGDWGVGKLGTPWGGAREHDDDGDAGDAAPSELLAPLLEKWRDVFG